GQPRRPRKITALMLDDTADEPVKPAPPSLGRILHWVLNIVLGPTIRFFVGTALIAGCLLWMWQNALFTQAGNVESRESTLKLFRADDASPLNIIGVPDFVTKWFNGYGAAVAGLLMLMAALLPNRKATLL